jgi:antitoxin FitA
MNKHVQIRNIPESKHRKLKARAAMRGMTITDYVERLIDRDLQKPSWAEIASIIEQMPTHASQGETPSESVRTNRDEA